MASGRRATVPVPKIPQRMSRVAGSGFKVGFDSYITSPKTSVQSGQMSWS